MRKIHDCKTQAFFLLWPILLFGEHGKAVLTGVLSYNDDEVAVIESEGIPRQDGLLNIGHELALNSMVWWRRIWLITFFVALRLTLGLSYE